MEVRNFYTIIKSNARLIFKWTLFPAIIVLLIIPQIYGISNLDSMKSADCLERMVALIGIPMFVSLLKPEENGEMDAIIALRPFPYQLITSFRILISLISTLALILVFEGYMDIVGCSFPIGSYTFRTLAKSMMLGFPGLLVSAVSKSTIVGFLVSFCWYCILQIESFGNIFQYVSDGINMYQMLLLVGGYAVIVFFCKDSSREQT